MRTLIVVAALLLTVTTADARWVWNPDVEDIPGWPFPPYPGQSVDRKDGWQARQRLKLLQRVFPGATDYPKDRCHFALSITPERTNPPYRSRNLVLMCREAPGVWIFFRWPRR